MKKENLISLLTVFILSCFLSACKQDSLQINLIKDFNLVETINDPLNVKPKSSVLFNVQDYCVSQIDDELNVEVSFYDDDPQLKSALNNNCRLWMENNLDCIELVKGDEKILLKWDRIITGTINLAVENDNSREEFIAIPDLNKKTWIYENSAFLQKNQQLLKLIASIASDFDYSFYRELRKNSLLKSGELRNLILLNKKIPDISINPNLVDPCSAIYQSSVHYNFSSTLCCIEATNEVNFECTNEFCIGCCSSSCDWGGIFGDFLGFCWAIGKGCTGLES